MLLLLLLHSNETYKLARLHVLFITECFFIYLFFVVGIVFQFLFICPKMFLNGTYTEARTENLISEKFSNIFDISKKIIKILLHT